MQKFDVVLSQDVNKSEAERGRCAHAHEKCIGKSDSAAEMLQLKIILLSVTLYSLYKKMYSYYHQTKYEIGAWKCQKKNFNGQTLIRCIKLCHFTTTKVMMSLTTE